ncbi:pilin [Micromonospora sp. WMMD1082]|uniref:pilin n=1 Tax=Micromonospora sp. WMMD1082 TaxID=3016104 RepID=UPI002416438F|nr:pilin [Micromonospora sp. WMMD1082]MDG4795382.1 pilin [Micromonospora sp. WMMD1082]
MFRRTIIRVVIVAVATVAVLAGASPAFAAEPPTPAPYPLPTIITNITNWITGLLVGVATLFLTIGGIRYLAAGGDPTEVEKAKSALKSAVLGYALAVLAPILLGIVRSWIGG